MPARRLRRDAFGRFAPAAGPSKPPPSRDAGGRFVKRAPANLPRPAPAPWDELEEIPAASFFDLEFEPEFETPTEIMGAYDKWKSRNESLQDRWDAYIAAMRVPWVVWDVSALVDRGIEPNSNVPVGWRSLWIYVAGRDSEAMDDWNEDGRMEGIKEHFAAFGRLPPGAHEAPGRWERKDVVRAPANINTFPFQTDFISVESIRADLSVTKTEHAVAIKEHDRVAYRHKASYLKRIKGKK